jgi:hypothetical protein
MTDTAIIAERIKAYRVWWIPQVPMKAFEVDVDTLAEAKLLIDVLADYDLFQYENKVKPDYCNTGGITRWDAAEGEYLDVDEDES